MSKKFGWTSILTHLPSDFSRFTSAPGYARCPIMLEWPVFLLAGRVKKPFLKLPVTGFLFRWQTFLSLRTQICRLKWKKFEKTLRLARNGPWETLALATTIARRWRAILHSLL